MIRCEGQTGATATEWGWQPIRCGRTQRLSAIDAPDGSRHYACYSHRADVRRRLARTVAPVVADRCHCGSPQDARGCSNSDCGRWMGPMAAAVAS